MDSPSDAFKDVFSEYGAKLSPDLMRLQLQSDFNCDDEDDDIEKSDVEATSLTQ